MNSSFPRKLGGVEIVDEGDDWVARCLKCRTELYRSKSLAEITAWAEERARSECSGACVPTGT